MTSLPPERIAELPGKLRDTTERMANHCSVDLVLWDEHSNACLDAATTILSLLSALEARTKALEAIFSVGDGWDLNTEAKPAGTTGEGHAECREIARAALAGQEERA